MDVLLGIGLGTISGLLAAIFLPLGVNKNPAGFVVVIAFVGSLFGFYLLGIFPLTVVVVTLAVLIFLWVTLPVWFGKVKTDKVITDIEERIVEVVSPEGRQAVLEELGIVQPMELK
jgi:uncharacterized membrane protein